jgi:hypothetical protein
VEQGQRAALEHGVLEDRWCSGAAYVEIEVALLAPVRALVAADLLAAVALEQRAAGGSQL